MDENIIASLNGTDIDCPNSVCHLEMRTVEVCHLYRKTEDHPNCSIPCNLSECSFQTYFHVRCPLWTCTEKITTTSSPSTTTTTSPSTTSTTSPSTTTTSSPEPPKAAACSSAVCISAVSFNAVLILVLALVCFIFRKKLRLARSRNYGTPEELAPIIRGYSAGNFSIENETANANAEDVLSPNQNEIRTQAQVLTRPIFKKTKAKLPKKQPPQQERAATAPPDEEETAM